MFAMIMVTEVEIEEISDFLAKEEAPLLFLYSSSDTLIKPAAVEEYIKTCTRKKLSFRGDASVGSSSLMQYVDVPMCSILSVNTPGWL